MRSRTFPSRAAALLASVLVFTGAQFGLSPGPAFPAQGSTRWVHQLSAGDETAGYGIASDDLGNSYLTGYTDGTLPGSLDPNAGGDDAFIAKYDAAGNRAWVHQLGSPTADIGQGVAIDAAGNAYVAGIATGTLSGSLTPNAGGGDAFIAKYDPAGNRIWLRQFGSGGNDSARSVAVDASGNPYVVGTTSGTLPGSPDTHFDGSYDLFLAKYDRDGNALWVHQLGGRGPSGSPGYGVGLDTEGNAYVAGSTTVTLPGSPDAGAGDLDVFLAKYDSDGARLWVRQLGSPAIDSGFGLAVDSHGNSYVGGGTNGTLPGSLESNAGNNDAFITKYDTGGNRVWVHQFGTASEDFGESVNADSVGNTYFTGLTDGVLPGSPETSAGSDDIFVAKYDAAGNRAWVHQLGGEASDIGFAVSADAAGNAYVAGLTRGTLPGSPEVNGDGMINAFIARVEPPTVPGTPRPVSAVSIGNNRAKVTWAMRAGNGGSPITGYVVTPYLAGIAQPARAFASAATTEIVTGLQVGKPYTLAIAASNGVGTGARSPHTGAIVAGAPGQPRTKRAIRVAPGSLKITFAAPSTNGAPIKGYTVQCASTNQGATRIKKDHASPIIVTGLTRGKTYKCTVRARNSRGAGPASRPSGAVKS